VTQDRDYEDDSLFPPGEGAGVIVFVAPDERRLCELLALTDRRLFRSDRAPALPLEGRKMRCQVGAVEIRAGGPGSPGTAASPSSS
jgi:hypothetical protein